MMVGDEKAVISMIGQEEKKAKESIARHYLEKEREYALLVERKRKEKKAILKQYYESIEARAEGYLKKENEYIKHYEDYKVLISAFNRAWEQAEERISEHPDDYVRFALAKFEGMLGKPDAALASKEFHPRIKYKAPTELSRNRMELRICRGKACADFSPSFIRELILPLYADRAMGEG